MKYLFFFFCGGGGGGRVVCFFVCGLSPTGGCPQNDNTDNYDFVCDVFLLFLSRAASGRAEFPMNIASLIQCINTVCR